MTAPAFIPATVTYDGDRPTYWEGLPISGVVSSPYASTEESFRANYGAHNAIDIAAAAGTPIRAPYPGVVYAAFGDGVDGVDEGSLGTFIVLRHEVAGYATPVFTGYAHLLRTPCVKIGEWVDQGQMIGEVGYSGDAFAWRNGQWVRGIPEASHLHFAIMEGVGYFNRSLDTFFNPASFVGAPMLPVKKPLPAAGSMSPFINVNTSTEVQYVFGRGAVVVPSMVVDMEDSYTLYVQGQEPKRVGPGVRAYTYTLYVPCDPDPTWVGN